MAMPENYVLLRHGHSEGNYAADLAKEGDYSAFTPEFMARHSSLWRLTKKGVDQAEEAGRWMRRYLDFEFDHLYTSSYIRAKETAALLGYGDVEWREEFYLRERDWGEMDMMSPAERKKKFAESLVAKKDHPLLWKPPNGLSLAEHCLYVDRMFDTMHRECSGGNSLMVCHGETMWCNRVRLERIPTERFNELDRSKNPFDRIHNCQIIHYTRKNPRTRAIAPYLNWVRFICPWNLGLSSHRWLEITRERHTSAKLMEQVKRVTPIHQ